MGKKGKKISEKTTLLITCDSQPARVYFSRTFENEEGKRTTTYSKYYSPTKESRKRISILMRSIQYKTDFISDKSDTFFWITHRDEWEIERLVREENGKAKELVNDVSD